MKNNPFMLCAALAILAMACTNPPAGQATSESTEADSTGVMATAETGGQGLLSITMAPEVTTAQYDQVVAELTTTGEWTKGWSYHAIGTMQPKGIFSMGVYNERASLEHRRAIFKELFPKLGVNAPAPQVFPVHNVILGAQPAQKSTAAIITAFGGTGMDAGKYAEVLKELEAAGAGAPAGRMYHVCYVGSNSLEVADVWESEAQFKAFGDILMPILQAKGINAVPAIYPLYNSLVVR